LKAWYIPPSWQGDHPEPKHILDAAKIASEAATLNPQRQIPFSNIPLVVHQKWNDPELSQLNSDLLTYIETWLEYSVSKNNTLREMAYFLWADDGVSALVNTFEPDFLNDFQSMFSVVEKVDIFRVLVCKWFGGIVRFIPPISQVLRRGEGSIC
jgi:mannosyltransferase OCH1-like enzyme